MSKIKERIIFRLYIIMLGPLHTWPVKSSGRRPNSSFFWARGEGRSSLKYIMFHLLARVWVSVFDASKLFLRGQTFGAKSAAM